VNRFIPSLLDRLFDDAVGSGADHLQRGMSLEQMKTSVARDIEVLLNTRTGLPMQSLDPYPCTRNSILSFGLQDFVGLSLTNPNDRDAICNGIRDAIERHEPRLREVRVTLSPHAGLQQFLNFTVTAVLVLDPAVEAVSFDALLQPVTQQYAVSLSRHAAPLSVAMNHG
jgi:type VI secretion system protein ImpF